MNKAVKMLFVSGVAIIFIFGMLKARDIWHKKTLTELLDDAEHTIVVLTPPSNVNTGGTGFEVYSPNGNPYTVTNKHVCSLAENGMMAAQVEYRKREVILKIIEVSETIDLCILEPINNTKAYKLGIEGKPHDHIYTIGHPRLAPNTFAEGHILERTVIDVLSEIQDMTKCTGKNKRVETIDVLGFFTATVCVESVDAFTTSVVIYPGNSGSPVFDDSNSVIGVMFAGDSATHPGSYIPLQYLEEMLKSY